MTRENRWRSALATAVLLGVVVIWWVGDFATAAIFVVVVVGINLFNRGRRRTL